MGAFEDFVNANLGIRKPLITDSGPPSSSLKAAGIVGSNYLDSDSNNLYEKTGENNTLDWIKIAVLGEARGGAGASGASGSSFDPSNFTGGLNIEMSGDSNLLNIYTPTHISGHVFTFDYSGIIGTGELVSFSVDDSGHVGVNTTGSSYNFHVAGSTCLGGGNLNLNYNAIPKSDPHQTGRVWISGSHHLMISSG